MRGAISYRPAAAMVLCAHLLVLLLLLQGSSGQLDGTEKRSGSRYCGRYLVQALQVVCNGVYNSPFIPMSKKSNGDLIPAAELMRSDSEGGGESPGFWLLRNAADMDGVAFPFRPKAREGLPFHRVTRGVHDECCRNSCTFQQLQMYCGRR